MLKRRLSQNWYRAVACCVVAFVLYEANVTFGQFRGGGAVAENQHADDAAPSQQLYPNGLPKIESMLTAALEHHPEVLAARSRLRTAEAELKQSELKALKDLIAVRDRWEKLNRTKSSPSASPPEVREAISALAAVELELAFLTRPRGETLTAPKAAGSNAVSVSDVRTVQNIGPNGIPSGEKADAIRKKLKQKIDMHLQESPLEYVATLLTEKSGMTFILDRAALDNAAIPTDQPITCDISDLDIASAIQALEDLQKPLYFLVRDYGILITTMENRSSHSVSVRDLDAYNDAELRVVLEQRRQEEAQLKQSQRGTGMF